MRDIVSEVGPCTVRVTKSQVAFRRRTGFAFLWMPGRYIARPRTDLVLTFDLPYSVESPRISGRARPTGRRYLHQVDISRIEDIDDEVAGWLRDSALAAGEPRG